MRLITWNINGLRSALKKDFKRHLETINPDVIVLQEIRVKLDQLPADFQLPEGFRAAWHPAERKGWSGVATWSRAPMQRQNIGFAGEDPEGRILHTQISGIHIINTYLPSGSSSPERQAAKDAFCAKFLPWSLDWVNHPEPVIICGDLNIAPTKDDVWNSTSAAKLSGFLPHEREWFATLLGTGWIDITRRELGTQKGPYSWWSNLGRAKAENRGWRIDHVLANPAAAKRIRFIEIARDIGIAVSDHAPVVVEIDL